MDRDKSVNKNFALFGGSFNPPHPGHLHIVKKVWEHYPEYSFFIIPSHRPPHKQSEDFLSDAGRLDCLRTLFTKYPVQILDWEIKRGGTSYTVDTVKHFYRIYQPRNKPLFIIGSDLVPGLSSWYDYESLKDLLQFVVIGRDDDKNWLQTAEDLKVEVLETEVLPLSSSECRRLFERGEKDLLEKKLGKPLYERMMTWLS